MTQVKQGDTVKIHFTGRLEDGTVFESSEGRDPLEFEAGSPHIIRGLSMAVIGMNEGEERTVTVPPEEGFGPYEPEMQQQVPLAQLPDGVKVGDQLQAQGPDRVIQVWVKEVGEDSALLDGNHPLAGREISFDLKLVAVEAG
jgi:FKBP-type peptidyl-prolyl cis-trans isomerase 2